MDYKFRNTMTHFMKDHQEQLSYLFFGVLTTIVNYTSFALLRAVWGDHWIHVVKGGSVISLPKMAVATPY